MHSRREQGAGLLIWLALRQALLISPMFLLKPQDTAVSVVADILQKLDLRALDSQTGELFAPRR
jgi:hypothetical protein